MTQRKDIRKDPSTDKTDKGKDAEQDKKHTVKTNPNPRANANVSEEDKNKQHDQGIGSEITDGEDA